MRHNQKKERIIIQHARLYLLSVSDSRIPEGCPCFHSFMVGHESHSHGDEETERKDERDKRAEHHVHPKVEQIHSSDGKGVRGEVGGKEQGRVGGKEI